MTNVYELNQEVKVDIRGGYTVIGKVVDFNPSQETIYVECNQTNDWVTIHPEVDSIAIVEQEEGRAPEGLKDLSTIKAEYKEELSLLWNKDVEYHNVMVFNSDEDDVEVWDCEFNTKMEDGERITIYFGTFYSEKDALKCARDMRTKLKRSYDIDSKVTVYSC